MSRDDFPDRGSRTRTASAGAARVRQHGAYGKGVGDTYFFTSSFSSFSRTGSLE